MSVLVVHVQSVRELPLRPSKPLYLHQHEGWYHHRAELRAGGVVQLDERHKAVRLSELKKETGHTLFWNWRVYHHTWTWSYMIDRADGSIVVVIREPYFTGEWCCLFSH